MDSLQKLSRALEGAYGNRILPSANSEMEGERLCPYLPRALSPVLYRQHCRSESQEPHSSTEIFNIRSPWEGAQAFRNDLLFRPEILLPSSTEVTDEI